MCTTQEQEDLEMNKHFHVKGEERKKTGEDNRRGTWRKSQVPGDADSSLPDWRIYGFQRWGAFQLR